MQCGAFLSTDRRPRAAVIDVEIRRLGSSVGATFFLLCSIRELARQRGGYDRRTQEPARASEMVQLRLPNLPEPS